MKTSKLSYWQVFRLIFVIFSLYLLRDVFYRWDGFRYYASFSEFLPNVALATILWTIISSITALLVWVPFKTFKWLSNRVGWEVKTEQLLLFLVIFLFFLVLIGAAAWAIRRYTFLYAEITGLLKLATFLCISILTIFITWLFRVKAGQWIEGIQVRITPLVWIFGIWFIISVPVLAHHTWLKQQDNEISQKKLQVTKVSKKRPNIILVTFDALAVRNMSLYGYHRLTTPFITKWAKEASVFTKVEAESTYTTPTTASLMTGKRVWTHQLYHLDAYKISKFDTENLPLLLKKAGYYNMAFVVNPYASVKKMGISKDFDIDYPPTTTFRNPMPFLGIIDFTLYQLFGEKLILYNWILKEDFILSEFVRAIDLIDFSTTKSPPKKALNKFLETIDKNLHEPFFVWIHLFPPHDPYLPPEPYMGMFDPSSELRTFKSQEKLIKISRYRRPILFLQEREKLVPILRARYDEFVRYCDVQFKDFIQQLNQKKELRNTVIILSSDHGEVFSPQWITHSGPPRESVTLIPLIVKEPNQTKGRIIEDMVEQVDIPATILDLAGLPLPSWMEGRSLVPLMRGKILPPKLAFSMDLERNPSRRHRIERGSIAVWEGNYKLIYYLAGDKSALFNLNEDPDEINNLFNKEPGVGQRLLNIIQNNLKEANERISRGR